MRASRLAAVACCIAMSPLAASADRTPTPEVRALVEQAQRHFDLAEYDKAISGFGKAYRLDPRPALLFNLAQAYRLGGDCVHAARMYRNFLRLSPGSKHRPLARRHLASIESCEQAQLDDRPLRAQPEPPPVEGEPLPPPVAAEAPTTDDPGRRLRLGGIASVATSGVALAVGSYYLLDAQRASEEVSAGYRDGAAWEDLAEIDARGRRSDTIGTTLLVTGGLAAAAGATMYYLGRRDERSAAVVPLDGGGQVVVTWGF